ncbi:MAG TPA: peptidylprolyl isomerase [Candidatus Competibacter sp.]|nr:peptidylprolyl isomerase [Candidatus Competibacteraceae bacterium]HRC73193.1 peptidylprolyl isomerase [Candidatus Competibacter sp.]
MKAAHGRVVALHYTLTDDEGLLLDSSRGHEPLVYLHGYGNIIRGLETALEGCEAGFLSTVKVAPADGYGAFNPEAVFEVPRGQFPPEEDIQVGMEVRGENEHGLMAFRVVAVNDRGVVLDGNHPMAGKNLNFDVEVLGVRDATAQELSHGHVHAHGHDH